MRASVFEITFPKRVVDILYATGATYTDFYKTKGCTNITFPKELVDILYATGATYTDFYKTKGCTNITFP